MIFSTLNNGWGLSWAKLYAGKMILSQSKSWGKIYDKGQTMWVDKQEHYWKTWKKTIVCKITTQKTELGPKFSSQQFLKEHSVSLRDRCVLGDADSFWEEYEQIDAVETAVTEFDQLKFLFKQRYKQNYHLRLPLASLHTICKHGIPSAFQSEWEIWYSFSYIVKGLRWKCNVGRTSQLSV